MAARGSPESDAARVSIRSAKRRRRGFWFGQEMQDCPVVPHFEAILDELELRHVGDDPIDRARSLAQATLSDRHRRSRDIDDGDRADAAVEQIVHQRGCTAADVDHSRSRVHPGLDQQLERSLEMSSISAHLIGGFGRVDLFPVSDLCSHSGRSHRKA